MSRLSYPNYFLLVPICIFAFTLQTKAQVTTYWYDFAVGGTSYHYVNGVGTVVQPGAQVRLTMKFELVRPYIGRVTVHHSSAVVTADSAGKWQTNMPCYYDLNGQYNGYFEVTAHIVGVSASQSGMSGGNSCTSPPDSLADSLVTNAASTEPDSQNNGKATCESVGKPVNVSNGNMWLRQLDFALPGIGESIRLERVYNSAIQDVGVFWSRLENRLRHSAY